MNDPLLKIFALSPFRGFYAKLLHEYPSLTRTQAKRRLHRAIDDWSVRHFDTLHGCLLLHHSNNDLEKTHRYLREHFVSILELQ